MQQPEEEINPQLIDPASLDVSALLLMAEQSMDKLNLEEAGYFYELCLKKEPQNVDVLAHYAEYLKQTDEPEKACQIYEKLIAARPLNNYKIFFQFAELKSGFDSIKLYQEGIKVILQQENYPKKDLADAYSAIAEVYQTDLLQLKESEAHCVKNIQDALAIDPENQEAKMQQANYFLNKEDSEKAKTILLQVADKIINQINCSQEDELEQYDQLFLLQCAKLLIEVEEFSLQTPILCYLIDLNEENIEAIYLLAYCQYMSKQYFSSLETIEELLLKEKLLKEDPEIQAAALELKQGLDKVDFAQALDGSHNQMVDGPENGEDWMDIE